MFHKSKFCYIKPIQLLPARTDVVKETMKRSIDIANTVKQRQAFVAYNLEIAKIQKKIQSEESPVYDKFFIMFGCFHIELSFFHRPENLLKIQVDPISFLDVILHQWDPWTSF